MELEPLISTKHFTHIAEHRRMIASLRDLKGSKLYTALKAAGLPQAFDLVHPPTGRITRWEPFGTTRNRVGAVIGWEFTLNFEQAVLYPEIQGYTLAILND